MKVLKRLGYFISLLLMGALIYTHTLLGLNPDRTWKSKFTDKNRPTAFKLNLATRTLYGVDTTEPDKTPLLMVHGSPGSWTGWEHYFKDITLREKYRLIAVDRPGFGYSGLGKPERSLAQQAADIAAVFERLPENQKVVLVGHSYGGPVVARIAMDYPDRVAVVYILAGSVDPELEETMFIQKLAHSKLFSWLVPPFAYSTNEEILALKESLEAAVPLWANITAPVVIIHGESDTLVPVANVDFMEEKLVNADSVEVIKIKNGSHFLPWEHFELITQKLLELETSS